MRRALFALALWLWTATAATAAPGVLVIFSDERLIPAHAEAEAGLRAALGLPGADVEYSAEFLDLTRFGTAATDGTWRDFIKAKYAGHDIRVVIVAAPGALDFMLRHQAELFPGRPLIVIGTTDDALARRTLPPSASVLPIHLDLAGTISGARRLQPGATEIVIPIGTNADDLAWQERARQQLTPVAGGLAIRFVTGSLEEIEREVASLTPSAIGLALPINRDGAGRARVPRESMRRIAAASGAPFYSVFSTVLGTDIVGGEWVAYEQVGRWAGETARRLLNGQSIEQAGTLAVPAPVFVADWRQLQRWGLDESRLPPGSEVRYRLPNVWQQYRAIIVTTVALLALLAIAIAALLIQRRHRDAAEIQMHQHRNELAHLTRVSLVGELSASIAHELNQPLTAILSNAQAAQRLMQAAQPDLPLIGEILVDIVADDRRAGDVIQRVRALLKKEDPVFEPIDCRELVESALRLAKSDLSTRAVTVAIEVTGDPWSVHGDRVQLQQVLLNLLVNAADTMGELPPAGRRITITLGRGDRDTVVFAVADRGHGIPDAVQARLFQPFFTTKDQGLGLGLAICRSIAEAHRGRLWAANNPDGGATFHLAVPKERRG